ncbi:succinylglutamate desuccinylase/aspartoacylase family protein [Octadecabacter sp. G9-8]|uniref:Succinylglutamate desuccinylase/aspartoacylase family protein n=1 Tax=Octadecabacter dasysiphoniae TaxID=2909341 RepID=A0ABS9CRM0_9RHOB|nr:succinylglutamate desuccinylase/aspartoacylase family protein [Octadecabacter dasysiphoniae]MCF2869732.1 succinylglutamate desuccinylase/aspartoacylase family protein [Octadecabacter dasysiphoniae]
MPNRKPFEFAGQTIDGGTRRTVDLPVSTLSDHTPVSLRVHVIHGKKAGPTVFVSAAVHGDEVMGVEIVRRFLQSDLLNGLRGTLMVVPIVNAFGFHNRSRYLPDRRDLNRSFPGSSQGSLASRLAGIFLDQVVKRCDLGIDLHSAAIHRTNLPQVRVSAGNDRVMALAKVFGAPVILTSGLREGSLRAEAAEAGVDVLLYEAGEGLRFDEMAARAGVAGILRVLRSMDMLPAKGIAKAKVQPLLCQSSKWLRAPTGGLLRTYRGDGDVVEEGEVIASVSDPFGEQDVDMVAPSDGIIIGRAVMPVVNEGDAVFHIADVRHDDPAQAVEDIANQLENSPLFDEDEII